MQLTARPGNVLVGIILLLLGLAILLMSLFNATHLSGLVLIDVLIGSFITLATGFFVCSIR
jgi:hypothetical protein